MIRIRTTKLFYSNGNPPFFPPSSGCLLPTLQELIPIDASPNATAPPPLLGKDEILQVRIDTSWRVPVPEYLNPPNSTYNAPKADYVFVKDAPLLYLSHEFWNAHNVNVVNVTMQEYCFAGDPISSWLAGFGGCYDTIMINQLMYTFRSNGAVQNLHTNETWGWDAEQIPPPNGFSFKVSILIKVLILIKSILAFVLVSTVTALIVRMLMSSGVILMFPLFYCLRAMGCATLDMHLLTLSYPWLGVPIEQLRARNKPVGPFIFAHLCKVNVSL